jgi:peptidase M48-like protein
VKSLICAVTVVFALVAPTAAAQAPARDAAAEKRIETDLAAIAPRAVPSFQAATRALDKGDAAEAIRLYRLVLVEVPSFTPAMRRLGSLLVESGQREQGFSLLTQAVEQERLPKNLYALARALAFPDEKRQGSASDLQRALSLAKEAAAHPSVRQDASYLGLVAAISLSLQKWVDFRDVVKALQATHPDDMETHYYSAILFATDANWIAAEREIHAAERRGLPHELASELLAAGVGIRARIWRFVYAAMYAVAVWALGLVVLFLVGRWLSAATLRSVETTDPNEVASPRELFLRRVYRALIQTAGVYYYVSLPFVVILVIGSTAAIFYVFILINRIPVQLAAALAFGAVITIYKMVHSLFMKVGSDDRGRSLEVAEAPGLWAMAGAVADQVGTRVIDEIRVTPRTELAVYERGSRRERAQDQARRTLLLGVGVLNGFRQGAFRAVLAHEYGHFAHRDTAGGDIALRVRQDMMKFALAMAQHGQAVRWNLAFQFLRVYDFLFRRISHGATRLQEIMADRVAAQKYGATLFEEGLRHVVRATIEFDAAFNAEVQSALTGRRQCQNLYSLESPRGEDIESSVSQALARPTTADDTHPGPLDRFRLISLVVSAGEPAPPGFVWDLFADREALTREMTASIEAQLQSVRAQLPDEEPSEENEPTTEADHEGRSAVDGETGP